MDLSYEPRISFLAVVAKGARSQLTQTEAAKLLGIDQPKVSALLNGKLSGFSTERLFGFLNAIGSDVEIRVIPKPQLEFKAQTRIVSA